MRLFLALPQSRLMTPSRFCMTDPSATGLPTPRPSLEFPGTTRPLAYDDVASMLKPLLEGTAKIRELSIDGVMTPL